MGDGRVVAAGAPGDGALHGIPDVLLAGAASSRGEVGVKGPIEVQTGPAAGHVTVVERVFADSPHSVATSSVHGELTDESRDIRRQHGSQQLFFCLVRGVPLFETHTEFKSKRVV